MRGFVDDVNAVSPTMASRNTLRLTIKSETKTAQIPKLTHGLLASEVRTTYSHRNSALDTPVRCYSARCKSRSLERQHLIRSKLLLIKSLLLLLQRLDLVLKSDLQKGDYVRTHSFLTLYIHKPALP